MSCPAKFHLPPEIIREIANFTCSPIREWDSEIGTGSRTKPLWQESIEGLSLASKAYRNIALAAWFYTLFVDEPPQIPSLLDVFPEIGKIWTRKLHYFQCGPSLWELQGLECVQIIHCDCLFPHMNTVYQAPDGSVIHLPLMNVSFRITELNITAPAWPSLTPFQNIEKILPDLGVLRMKLEWISCDLCNLCRPARFRAPGPDKIVYEGGIGLPMQYARAFSGLKHLHSVYITIADYGEGRTSLSAKDNTYLWVGECDGCMKYRYEDTEFRNLHVAKKRGYNVDGTRNPCFPPSLQRVEWNFWKGDDSDSEGSIHYFGYCGESDHDSEDEGITSEEDI